MEIQDRKYDFLTSIDGGGVADPTGFVPSMMGLPGGAPTGFVFGPRQIHWLKSSRWGLQAAWSVRKSYASHPTDLTDRVRKYPTTFRRPKTDLGEESLDIQPALPNRRPVQFTFQTYSSGDATE